MKRTSKLPVIFAGIHLLIVLYILCSLYFSDDGVKCMIWFLLYYIDFPYSHIIYYLPSGNGGLLSNFWIPLIVWGIGGTFWWYYLTYFLHYIFHRIKKALA